MNSIYVLMVILVIASGNIHIPSIEPTEGEEPTFTITLDSDNVPPSLDIGEFGSGTNLSRFVNFDYELAKKTAGCHAIFAIGGKLSNNASTRITSIKSITAVFSGSEATLTAGWRALPNINPQPMMSNTPIVLSDNPYYFVITNAGSGTLSLISLTITYSCSPRETAGGMTFFGMYPQTIVTQSGLISNLNTAAKTLPTPGHNRAWTDYGYYIYASISSYMWYIDITYGNDAYRGVYFTNYRPYYPTSTSQESTSYQDNNGYYTNSVYWFKYEPISWRVLDVQADEAFLLADCALDSQNFHHSTSTTMIDTTAIYSNNYAYSDIRSWLNDNFYNTAFTIEEKARIRTTNVDNSPASSGYETNEYACENINDKVFLLSHQEAISSSYGLSLAEARQYQPSPYAKSQGAYIQQSSGRGFWWLRSPDTVFSAQAQRVHLDGSFFSMTVDHTTFGIVPGLWISL